MTVSPFRATSVLSKAAMSRVAFVSIVLLALWGAVGWAVSVP